jgi:hypothetical protein
MEEKHSRLGIASFAISMVVGLLFVALFAVAGVLNAGRFQRGGSYPGQALIGFIAIFLLTAEVVAVGLGIASVCQSARKRVLGILGLTCSSLTLLGVIALMIIGLVYAAHFRS